jgi:hypothetical protein
MFVHTKEYLDIIFPELIYRKSSLDTRELHEMGHKMCS